MKHDRLPAIREASILNRKRFQFVGALMIGALLPWALRGPLPGKLLEPTTLNALGANVAAIIIAFWMRLSIETYPGIRRAYVILPSALTGHGLTLVWFLMTRFGYDRIGLALGFVLHVVWLFALYVYAERRVLRRIAVVPFGRVQALHDIDGVEWKPLVRPRLHDARNCSAIASQ